jgi:anthranilate phosphoribosyltransferase
VAKHGNRSVSSTSGSSDVLEQLGMPLDLDPVPRKELGMRTMFNILGPLTNPAGVKRQVIGVFSADLCEPLAGVLKALGAEHAMIVHSDDGLDEISIAAGTQVAELREGSIACYRISPEDFGRELESLEGLSVDSAAASAQLIRDALGGAADEAAQKAASIIALNAGATIYVSGVAATLADGVAMAEDVLATGQALEKLDQFINFTQLMRGGSA